MESWVPMQSNRAPTRDFNALGIELPFKPAIRQNTIWILLHCKQLALSWENLDDSESISVYRFSV